MPFIDDILHFRSLSIVGMEKNTGKTETLNYIIRRLYQENKIIAVTSIGIDGESTDQVTFTHKPEIRLFEDSVFITSEKHYLQKQLVSEIINVSDRFTSLGRLVTGRVKIAGKVILSGPSDTIWLKRIIGETERYGVDITLVDGALSRRSLGSPAVTESMVLTTGAAVSHYLPELVKKTKFVFSLINLEEYRTSLTEDLLKIENGIWSIGDDNRLYDLNIPSTLLLDRYKDKLFEFGHTLFVSGILTDKTLDTLRLQPEITETRVVVKDFTKIFASSETVQSYLKKGGKINVLLKTRLIAVCINPVSPAGYRMDSEKLQKALEESLEVPVYDIKSPRYGIV